MEIIMSLPQEQKGSKGKNIIPTASTGYQSRGLTQSEEHNRTQLRMHTNRYTQLFRMNHAWHNSRYSNIIKKHTSSNPINLDDVNGTNDKWQQRTISPIFQKSIWAASFSVEYEPAKSLRCHLCEYSRRNKKLQSSEAHVEDARSSRTRDYGEPQRFQIMTDVRRCLLE